MRDTTVLILAYLLVGLTSIMAQTKVSGHLFDQENSPIAFANVVFKGSTTGTITDENGKFYLQSDTTWDTLEISFLGYKTLTLSLTKKVNYNLNLTLESAAQELSTVVITGEKKQPKKNNPAVDILRKIWANKRSNGLKKFKQYEYEKYEKVEFDINTIDSAYMKRKLFRGIEFVFKNVDTSEITGTTYLPVFINESVSRVYGDNLTNKNREVLRGNKNSGFSDNQQVIDFAANLYPDFDIYENRINMFEKSFVSPLSRTGINTYNYVLSDSAYIDKKWCYNIIYYPRRKAELTFKGDFWVADTTFAIKNINLKASKQANLNWVREFYIERDYKVLNDSTFLIKRDYIMSDFALKNGESERGLNAKRTVIYTDYRFDQPKPETFYEKKVYAHDDQAIYDRDDAFWAKNRLEKLNKDEKQIYKMLDTLKTVKKFKRIYNAVSILTSGYVEFNKLPLDYGPIFSTIGSNQVEGLRLRVGGRTYFGKNDRWRLEGYSAYGFKDDKFKYGLSGKWLLDRGSRLILSMGNRRDVDLIGNSLMNSDEILGSNLASSSLFGTGSNNKLTTINLSSVGISIEPKKNLILKLSGSYRTLESASSDFNLNYNKPNGTIASEVKQFETAFSLSYYPKRRMTGYGVERNLASSNFPRIVAKVRRGDKRMLNSDFDYTKFQFSYTQPWQIGPLGRLTTSIEAGKTFGDVAIGLLSPLPGNETFYGIDNTFALLDNYEFVTDTYATLHLEHNFNGRFFSRIPLLRKLNLREIIGFRAAWGEISKDNVNLNKVDASSIPLIAPTDEIYYEYSLGIGNIFKIFRVDFNFRGNYLDNTPDVRKSGITAGFSYAF